jgi:hypothetical protein
MLARSRSGDRLERFRPERWLVRLVRLIPILISLTILSLYAYFVITNEWWVFGGDAEAYYLAAERVVAGEPLYVEHGLDQAQLYRYAPWFAYLFVPLTVLPVAVVTGGMAITALAASIAVLWPLRRPSYESLGLLLLIAPALVHSAYLGNVQALMVAAVMYLPARGAWIGVAASLKGAALALAFAEDRRTLYLAVAVAAVGLAPMLLFDLSGYPSQHGIGLWAISPLVWAVAAVLGGIAAYVTGSRIVAAAVAIIASPYFLGAYLAWLMVPIKLGETTLAMPSRHTSFAVPLLRGRVARRVKS